MLLFLLHLIFSGLLGSNFIISETIVTDNHILSLPSQGINLSHYMNFNTPLKAEQYKEIKKRRNK